MTMAKGAPTILVVGTTGDSATPYEHAVSMAEQLESGVLLTFDGAGHGAVTGGNKCIGDAVSRFLEEGIAPEDGTTCSRRRLDPSRHGVAWRRRQDAAGHLAMSGQDR